MAVGEVFLSAFLQVLFDRLASREFIKLVRNKKYDDILEKLKMALLGVAALLNDAEEKQFYSPTIDKWLRLAKDAVYQAEDILDELATQALECQLRAESQTSFSSTQVSNWRLISSPLNLFTASMESKLGLIIDKLEFIARHKDVLGLKDDNGIAKKLLATNRRRLPTTSLVEESYIHGRETDKERIIKFLLRDDQDQPRTFNKVTVVPIVGMAGIGKTTLAQLVYNDSRVDSHFELKVWISVSDQFDVLRTITQILKSVSSKPVDLDDLNLLQVSLKKKLEGKKFLLVLDDVWQKRNHDWEVFWSPFRAGARGSKVILTTRDMNVASSMSTVPAHQLRCLSFEDCWSVFMDQAFEVRNAYDYPKLEAIGRQIVKKYEGLPLAAKRLGIFLQNSEEEEEWMAILNGKIWDLPDDETEILEALRLSYHYLPPYLKQCFAYCSIFPRNYVFDKDSMVLLWMAEGFVQQPEGMKRLEEVGGDYFDELVSRSLFQQSIDNDRSRFTLHGLVKDLADFVSGEFCFTLEDKLKDIDQKRVTEKTRHSSYIRSVKDVLRKFEVFNGAECLSTFLPLNSTEEITISYMDNKIPYYLLPKLRYLRVLSFKACRITELPVSIGDLKHLRYLDLSQTAITRLPDSVNTLHNLQTLILLQCSYLSKLPSDMGNLRNLRHLRISRSRLREMPRGMFRLKNLQTLSCFVLSRSGGSGITDLRDISQLQGSLYISGLQNIVNCADALEAKLKDKTKLDQLVLKWSNNFDSSVDDRDVEEVYKVLWVHREHRDATHSSYRGARFPSFREAMQADRQESTGLRSDCRSSFDGSRNEITEMRVLELLEPHQNIKQLIIEDFGGTKFPNWSGSPLFFNLVFIKLSNCMKCRYLPPLGQLPSLKGLTLERIKGIKKIGIEFYGDRYLSVQPFPSLETLKFENMPEWEDWTSSGAEGMQDFCNLQDIEIQNCPKLKNFSHCFPSLKRMSIMYCENLEALPSLDNLRGREFPCLVDLSIRTCPNLKKLPGFFPSLRRLKIDGCQDLAVLPKFPEIHELQLKNCRKSVTQGIAELTSLTYLHLCEIPKLKNLVKGFFQHLTVLEKLQITHLDELTTLSNEIGVRNLLHLQQLEISACSVLKDLPRSLYQLSSLKQLRVWNCPTLISFPEMGLPRSLTGLEIRDCEALEFLPEELVDYKGNDQTNILLEYMVIEGCSSLKSLPRGKLPCTLIEFEIQNCINLESLPKEMMSNSKSIEFFKISGCHSVRNLVIGTMKLLEISRLKHLIINDCRILESLPEGLHNLTCLEHLEIVECPHLESFPSPGLPTSMLRSVKISNCRSLKSLPDRMCNLTSLQELCINGCSSLRSFPEGGLPGNLLSLTILDCENLKPSYDWGLHRLAVLTDLSFGGCQALVSFPEDWLLPSNLTCLNLQRLPNLKSLPEGLEKITSLQTLEIWESDSLQTLPEEGSPDLLTGLWNVI